MMQEINVDTLVAYVLGELDEAHRSAVDARLADEPDLTAALGRVRRMLHALGSRDVQDLAPPLHARLRALFPAPVARPSWLDTAAQAVLSLLLDTRLAPARGFRSWTDDTFLLTFGNANFSIDLQVSPTRAHSVDIPGRWALRGCAEIDGCTQPVEVALLSVGRRQPVFTASDEHGQFSLEVPAGACSLALNTGQRVFTTPPFDIP